MSGAGGRALGRTRRKLVALLEAEGFSDIQVAAVQGHYRTSPYADTLRWEGFARRAADGIRMHIYSWETMTKCVRQGIKVSERDKGTAGSGYEIWPKPTND